MPTEVKIYTDPTCLDADWVCRSVLASYWGGGLNADQIKAALKESVVWGAYVDAELPPFRKQIGFVRAVSDFNIFSSITDVIVEEKYRGMGVGTKLMETALASDGIVKTICILQSRPQAFLWYYKFGFQVIDAKSGIMRREPNSGRTTVEPSGRR